MRAGHAQGLSDRRDQGAGDFTARPVTVVRAYEKLANQIRSRILAGELAEGHRLPSENTIGQEARVSRSTVREALRVLEEGGFVERTSPRILVVRQAHGGEAALRETTRVLQHSQLTFDDLIQALLAIDPALTRLAAKRVDASQIARLEAHIEEQRTVLADPERWSRLDDEFHVMIGEMSGNAPLLLARRSVSDLVLPVVWWFVRDEPMTSAAFTFHERIIEQIRVRDFEAAAFMTHKHINDFRRAWEQAGLDVNQPVSELG